MTKFRSRLLFALITLIMFVLVAVGLLLGQVFKSYYLSTFQSRLEKETGLIASEIKQAGGIDGIDSLSLSTYAELLEVRISIINGSNEIIFDGGQEEYDLTSHRITLQNIVDQWESRNDTLNRKIVENVEVRYYWEPITNQNGTEQGLIVLSTSTDVLKAAYGQIWLVLAISLGLSLIIIVILGSKITEQYTKPIESATNVAIELAKGNYRARTYEDYLDETSMLSTSINILARNLQEMVSAQELQQDRLLTLIENMGSGLLLIDPRGFVVLMNKTFKELFEVDPSNYLKKRYHEAIQHEDIIKVVEEVFMTEEKVRKQLLLPLHLERKHFEVYGAPIIGISDEWKGILLVFHDITELEKIRTNAKRFVANVSHELKTPITSIKGFSETLLDGALEDRDTLEYFLNIMLTESDRLQSLIQDLLDLSKLEQHGFKLDVSTFDLSRLIEEVVLMLKGKAEEKEIQLQFDPAPELTLEGDMNRFKQVFINLINNAISYTGPGGHVKVFVKEERDEITIKVQDNGVGIAASELPRIFERFYRIDKARSRNSGGTGLGLAIVKHIVEAHHGEIDVESSEGVGTTFIVKVSKEFQYLSTTL
ncbi:alkaline phosphatase [Bacillus coahuilensis p1.1.43]|uniref:histidine kinase n=1 Tax=Bacillus coahuilensis p1.1.43 TaxID=1150625 RepID=A0A147K6M2_9BACI|nr:ATP-binding protein [Bacillus coahuilensis]KUP05576.1 alkaline phosphatase [Bacillus coahuilensis p1.1.43]